MPSPASPPGLRAYLRGTPPPPPRTAAGHEPPATAAARAHGSLGDALGLGAPAFLCEPPGGSSGAPPRPPTAPVWHVHRDDGREVRHTRPWGLARL
jgi:hypothetical protein